MKKYIVLSILFFTIINCTILAQETLWPKVFNDLTAFKDFSETYDGGIVAIGTKLWYLNGESINGGVIMKIDVNGNVLWQKIFDYSPPEVAWTQGYRLETTTDGGFIITGLTSIFYQGGTVFYMKLNSCGEKEWVKFISGTGAHVASPIYELDDGSFLTTIGQWGEDYWKRLWVFKFSADGRELWHKLVGYWNPPYTNTERVMDFYKSTGGDFIIAGDGGVLEPDIDTLHWWTRPLFIKIDTAGNELWHHFVTGLGDEFYNGSANNGCTDNLGNIYSAGSRWYYPKTPEVIKISPDGETVFYKDLTTQSDSVYQGWSYDMQSMTDNTFYSMAAWLNTSDTVVTYAYKLDSSGNVTKRKLLSDTISLYYPMGSTTTSDSKYVVGSYEINSFEIVSYIWKLQPNLEYDTLYTQQFTYDSLCPYPITNDTIALDTTMVINLEHLWHELKPMSIFPNPVKNKLNIIINIVKWQERQLVIRDINGREILNEYIAPGKANHQLDVSAFENGIYMVSLLEKAKLLQTEKVVVSH